MLNITNNIHGIHKHRQTDTMSSHALLSDLRLHHITKKMGETNSSRHFFRIWRDKHELTRVNMMWNAYNVGEPIYKYALLLNQSEHHLWGHSQMSEKSATKVIFKDETTQKSENGDITESPTEPLDGHETPRGRFASIINAQFKGEDISKYISGDIDALDEYFRETEKKMLSGENIRVWDGQSTKIEPRNYSLLLKTYNAFKDFIQPNPDLEERINVLREIQTPVTPEDEIEARFQRLLAM